VTVSLTAPLVITVIMLFASLIPGLPYAYFQILRWVACATFCFGAFISYQRRISYLIWAFIAAAILFNPFAPIRFKRSVWEVLDSVIGILSVVALIIMLRTNRKANRLSNGEG